MTTSTKVGVFFIELIQVKGVYRIKINDHVLKYEKDDLAAAKEYALKVCWKWTKETLRKLEDNT